MVATELLTQHSSSLTKGSSSLTLTDSPSAVTTLFSSKVIDEIPFLDLDQTDLKKISRSDSLKEDAKLQNALRDLLRRVENLVQFGTKMGAQSHILKCCSASLNTRMPLVVKQTEQLIQKSTSENLVMKMRSTVSLLRAMQYVDRIQEAMDPETNEGLEEQLTSVLEGLDMSMLPKEFRDGLTFRVSPWISSVLCFDLPVGESAHSTLKATTDDQLDLQIEVEPVVEFRAHDVASTQYARFVAKACQLQIEKVSHVKSNFGLGAGMIGEATIRVRISPLADSPSAIWGSKDRVESLHLKEARAVQVNAYPPKPKSNIDLYTSYEYGEASVTVTAVVETFTCGHDIPTFHLELFMAPPSCL